MSETNTQEVKEPVVQSVINPFSEESWVENPVPIEASKTEENKPADSSAPAPTVEESKEEDELIDPNEWVKKNYGWESAEAGKKELEELRKLKESAQTELKFANEDSRKFYEAIAAGKSDEIRAFLNRKEELSNLDKLAAEQAIKMNIQYSNPHFKAADIQDVYEEQYSKPDKPTQQIDEADEDYNIRLQKWQAQVEKIERKIERDSFSAKEQLAKYNSELVLPDIPKKEETIPSNEIDPKILEQFNNYKGLVHQKLESDAKNFAGFNVVYKDEAVEIPITFNVTDEEKKALLLTVKDEVLGNDFNVNDYFAKRWFDVEGNPNVGQMMADIYLMNNPEKVFQKFANESASKRLEHKIKVDSNIVVDKVNPQGTFQPDNRPESQKVAEFFWNQ